MYNEKEDPLILAQNYKKQGNVLLEKTNKTLKDGQDALLRKKSTKFISESEYKSEMKKLDAQYKQKLHEVVKYYQEGIVHGEKYIKEYEERKDAFIKFKHKHPISFAMHQMKEKRKTIDELEEEEEKLNKQMTEEDKAKKQKEEEYFKRFFF